MVLFKIIFLIFTRQNFLKENLGELIFKKLGPNLMGVIRRNSFSLSTIKE